MDFSADIKDYIVDNFLFGEANDLEYNTHLFNNGILDSTGAMELVCYIEDTYNVIIEDDELTLENFQSLDTINMLLCKKLSYSAG